MALVGPVTGPTLLNCVYQMTLAHIPYNKSGAVKRFCALQSAEIVETPVILLEPVEDS